MGISRAEPTGGDLSNINLGEISYSPKYGETGDTIRIETIIENNSFVGTVGYPRINFYREGEKFNSVELEERDMPSQSSREWVYQYQLPEHNVSFEVEAVEVLALSTEVDDRSDMFLISHGPAPEKGNWKEYVTPVGLGGAVGFGAAEVYEEPSIPIVILGAGSGAALKYAGDAFSESLQKMNLPTWSIWGVSLGVIGSGIVLGQFTELIGG